ncbi:MAG TPA: hypothetical protein VGB46_03390 [Flavisolibacter sp.]|jgi:hypothetical protein
MKLLFCLLAGMLSLGLAAQKPFEGTIRYKLTMTGLSDPMNISIFFGPGKALLRVEQEKGMVMDPDMLIDLDSGYVHRLNAGSKTYKTKKLRSFEDKPQVAPGNRTILGHAATGVNLGEVSGSMSFLRLMSIADKAVVYTANDLLFPVPAKYEQNAELMFVHKGHIVLGGELTMGMGNDYGDEDEGSDKMPSISLEALEIIARPVDPALLRIPADYVKWSRERMQMHWDSTSVDTAMIWDSAVVKIDTAYSMDYEVTPPPPPKAQVKKAPAKKPAAKKPATKTGTSGTKKQAARKPE